MDSAMLHPSLMNRSLLGSGVKVVVVEASGLAGAWDWPFFVMNAKLTNSGEPIMLRQVVFCSWPVTGFCSRLKMFTAAHHLVASHVVAPLATCQTGQGTQPGV